ncbi:MULTISPECIES: N-acetyltransferase [Methanobacterium]|jgi:ribosomal protein S18 acetylase RimI-like enzyme|uniref:Acetyltransferase GNAT family n=1 Tax=Methanobacterium formicicum TaxID=2162 RepID=A0A089ZFS3_METFO|nr:MULTISPECIES: GNAT family N-acetyltransferase [Methanobacterium]AIS30898.1 acetyltransferase GNAT family [Methanobacterium formicicum]KUK75457.1 MAG: GCN5-related N-acetyltransferase family protein [Methanobacterium sp. 42_16]MBF4474931.1 GNAT family N-acetyltransferase [Methanobacterium formicicum]MDD4810798.1 GNAT family N-acetyltransferase [Methanobacterium formicicum]MDH2658669.1 GNAT family N-acetyltransferase [Methanobacterium formicicum]
MFKEGIRYRKCNNGDFIKLHEINQERFINKTSLTTFKVGERLHKNTIFLAEDRDKAVGYVFGMRSQNNPEEGWIRQIAVLKKYEGRGIAKTLQKLCIEAFKSMRGVRYVGLSVEPGNKPALCLYKSLGFKIAEGELGFETVTVNGKLAIKDYYGPGEHRFIMKKEL